MKLETREQKIHEAIRKKAYELFIYRTTEQERAQHDWYTAEKLVRWERFRHWRWLSRWRARLVLPVVTGLLVALFWHGFEVIKPWNIGLWLPYAYEYRYRDATSDRGNESREILRDIPIIVPFTDKPVGFVFAIENKNIRSLKNVSLHLSVPQGVEVTDPGPFTPFWPNKEYFFYYTGQVINNGIIQATEAGDGKGKIYFKFKEPREYRFTYYIAGEDIKRVVKTFNVKVVKS